MGEGRGPHLVDAGHAHAVVAVAVQTRQNLPVGGNRNLVLRKLRPPGRTPQQLMGRGGGASVRTWQLITSVCACVGPECCTQTAQNAH